MTYSPFIPPTRSQFDEQIVVSKDQIINLKSIYGISALRDVVTLSGSATATNATGEYKLSTSANGADSVIFDSAEQGRYYSGQDALAGIGARLAANPTGNQSARWGYYNSENGFGFGKDATGLFIFDRKGGAETKVYQNNWNTDTLDGNGKSGVALDESDGAIYQINFTWYGYGTISFEVVYFDSQTNDQKAISVHKIRKTGSVSIEDPNLPIRAEVDNGGSDTAFDSLYIGGRQFSTLGKKSSPRRITSDIRLNVGSIGTTFIPMVSLRRKAAFSSVSVKTSAFEIITDFDAIIEVRMNPTLTGANYQTPTNYSATETALESDISATGVSGGEVIFSQLLVASGKGGNSQGSATIPLIEQDFIKLQPVSVIIRRVSGSGGNASCLFRAAEEW